MDEVPPFPRAASRSMIVVVVVSVVFFILPPLPTFFSHPAKIQQQQE